MARRGTWVLLVGLVGVLVAGCASVPPTEQSASTASDVAWLDRITWGVTDVTLSDVRRVGREAWLDGQLHPTGPDVPGDVAAAIDQLSISRTNIAELVRALDEQRRAADAIHNDDDKKAAQQAYQRALTAAASDAAARSLLRDLYSTHQLREQMTWFWMNHFSVFMYKANLRALVGDFEEQAIRPHALGRFRDLLLATMTHPAMLRYLDNEQNAAGHINENYARELMELHTLGVHGGYTQQDVQELARVLTGLGVNLTGKEPNLKPELRAKYVHAGLFDFNPARHDRGDKMILGHRIHASGMAEVQQVADILAHHPSTAHYVSEKLATYFVGDDPSAALVDRMAATFLRTDGDIAATLSTLFHSDEFTLSLGRKFKDPVHYVVSAVRLAYGERHILNPAPMRAWLERLGEPLYGRLTPDGYPLSQSTWTSPGQMVTRFEIARTIATSSAGLFTAPDHTEQPAFPQLANAFYYNVQANRLSAQTRTALGDARSAQEWNTFLLASPEFMYR